MLIQENLTLKADPNYVPPDESPGTVDDKLSIFLPATEDEVRRLVNKSKSKKVKVRSYIARYPVHRTAQSALHFTPWQTCSFQGHLNFFGKYSATLQLLREGYSFTYPPLSVLPGTHLYS